MPKITELPDATDGITDDDFLVIVDDADGTPSTRRVSATAARNYMNGGPVIKNISTLNALSTYVGFGITQSAGVTNRAMIYTGRDEYHVFWNMIPRTITSLAFSVAVASVTAGHQARFGIYRCTENMVPTDLIIDFGAYPIDAVATVPITGLSLTLPAGLYYLNVVSQSAWTPSVTPSILPVLRNTASVAYVYRGAVTTVATAMPSTASAINTAGNYAGQEILFITGETS